MKYRSLSDASVRSGLRRGFTLVEMILVITIMVILFTMVGTSLRTAIRSQTMNGMARRLSADLDYAALLAQKENAPIEIRFYQYQDSKNGQDTAQFRAYQFVKLTGFDDQNKPVYRFLSAVNRFEQGIILHPSATFTTLAALPQVNKGANDATLINDVPYTYVRYQIRPDGSTTLPRDAPQVVTLVNEAPNLDSAALPDDYRSVTLNAFNARVKVY